MANYLLKNEPWRSIACVALLVAASGCVVGPDHAPPHVAYADTWASDTTDAAATQDIATWWRRLGDPVLDRLVEEALQGNLDLRIAGERVNEARARRAAAAGGLLPTVAADGSMTRQRLSQSANPAVGAIPSFPRDQTLVDAGIDARWELDLFGGRRRAVEAASARESLTRYEVYSVRISVVAEVVTTYIELRGLQAEYDALSESEQLAAETLRLTRLRVADGYSSEGDAASAETQLRELAAELARVDGETQATAAALGILLGEPPESEMTLANSRAATPTLVTFPVGTRAELLRRRPDVAAAERRVAAETADIGVATAELFPKIGFGGNAGFQSLGLSAFGSPQSQAFSIGGLISWRLFDGGRVRAEINAERAQQRQALLSYEQVVLISLTEAEQAIIRYRQALRTAKETNQAVVAARRAATLARRRLEVGDISQIEYATVADAEFRAVVRSARSSRGAVLALVTLYKSLGGGWALDAGS